MPLVFGILAFVYSGHGVFPSVRASMKEPEEYPKASAKALHTGCYSAPGKAVQFQRLQPMSQPEVLKFTDAEGA